MSLKGEVMLHRLILNCQMELWKKLIVLMSVVNELSAAMGHMLLGDSEITIKRTRTSETLVSCT
jgi:hypothetical protein